MRPVRKDSDLCLKLMDFYMVKATGGTLPGLPVPGRGLGPGKGHESIPTPCSLTPDRN